jgi:hypothetical protein
VLNYSFKYLTLRLSYELVLSVVGLSNGTLEILRVFHEYSPWAIQELIGSLELEILMSHAMSWYRDTLQGIWLESTDECQELYIWTP